MRRVGATLLALGAALPVLAQEPAEILIRNGLIVTETGRLRADLRIRGGEIAEIARNLTPARGARTIDATGKLVLPGGIDTHVHLNPVRTPDSRPGADDFESASRAALAGGITTIGAFIGQNPAVPVAQTLAEAADAASRTTIADAILHLTISDPAKLTPADITMLRERGVTPKIFMRGMAFEQRLADNLKLIEGAGKAGLLTQLHAEDAAILAGAMDRLMAQGRTALVGQNFADSHPVEAEEVAVQRAVGFAEFTGAPPLRDQTDRDYLWAAIARGSVDAVNTDHVGYTRAEKMDPGNSVQRPREGSNFLQDQMPLLYSEGVRRGRISLERMVAVAATNPAKLFGLYPRKGVIAVGADADVVIWDPELTRTIRRGQVVYENGKIVAAPGSGRLAPRTRWQRP